MLSHATEELAYVMSGRGELRLEDGDVPVRRRARRCTSRRGVWHTVVNTGRRGR